MMAIWWGHKTHVFHTTPILKTVNHLNPSPGFETFLKGWQNRSNLNLWGDAIPKGKDPSR